MVISNSKYGKKHAGTKNKGYWTLHADDLELNSEIALFDSLGLSLSQFERLSVNRLEGFEE
jgi:hypothetical protein